MAYGNNCTYCHGQLCLFDNTHAYADMMLFFTQFFTSHVLLKVVVEEEEKEDH